MKNLILTIMTAALCCCTGTGDDSEFVKTDLMEEGLKGPVKEMRTSNRASQTCYKFNEAGFLTEKFDLITKSHGRDVSERPKDSRKYHPNGKLAERLEYSGYPDDYKHYTYNENGDILSDLTVVNKKVSSKNEYRYEETGKSSYNMFKNNVLCEEVKYDGKRRPVKITTFDSGVKVKSSTTVYKYDGKGRIKEKSATYYKDDKYVSIQLYEYTPDGKILKRTEKKKRHPSPKFDVQTYEYKYTGDNLEIKHSDYRPSEMGVSERSKKPVVETTVVKYDKYGNSLQDYSFEYDEYGNWTSRKNSHGITVRYFVYYSDNKSDGVQDVNDGTASVSEKSGQQESTSRQSDNQQPVLSVEQLREKLIQYVAEGKTFNKSEIEYTNTKNTEFGEFHGTMPRVGNRYLGRYSGKSYNLIIIFEDIDESHIRITDFLMDKKDQLYVSTDSYIGCSVFRNGKKNSNGVYDGEKVCNEIDVVKLKTANPQCMNVIPIVKAWKIDANGKFIEVSTTRLTWYDECP